MKTLRIISAIIAFIMISLSSAKSALRRGSNTCTPACPANKYCTAANTCEPKKKKGEPCSGNSTSVTDQCVDGTKCEQNPVTKNYRCN